jgi:hypothetical protein
VRARPGPKSEEPVSVSPSDYASTPAPARRSVQEAQKAPWRCEARQRAPWPCVARRGHQTRMWRD